jgi:thiol-disulfide isomerase/thioredoxin
MRLPNDPSAHPLPQLRRRDLIAGAALVSLVSSLGLPSIAGAVVPARRASLDTLLAARDWLNGEPTRDDLRGKVVLVDVFTFDCINCQNITPNLRALARTKHPDLAIVGIHSPETSYERERGAVITHLAELGVTWPVAIDNDFALWHAYGIEYWPTQMLFDRRGKLRTSIIGDSQDAAVDAAVAALLRESA